MAGARLAALRLAFGGAGRLAPGSAARAAEALFAHPQRHPRRPWEVEIVRRGEPLTLPGDLPAVTWGAGPPVLLVHGGRAGARSSPRTARRTVVLIASPSSLNDAVARFEALVALPPRVARRFEARLEDRTALTLADLDIARFGSRLADTAALVVHSLDDDEVPYGEAERIVGAWPGATLSTVLGGDHRRLLREPDVVREVVAFVGGVPAVGVLSADAAR